MTVLESPPKTADKKSSGAKSTRRIGAQNSAGRDAILKAAIGVLQDEGAAGLTASNVAKKADVKAHMVHYYFRSIEDLVLALIRQHGSLGLKNTARAIASDEPLRALWEVETSFKWMSVAMELSSIAVRRDDMRAEMMRYIEDMRHLQAEGIKRHFQLRGIECAVPPLALTIMVAGIARQIVREKEFNVSLGHEEMSAVVETFLENLRPASH
ncbi:MAG: TetR/AcrR family transcriptional regulator [Pseudomonas sp.]|nr:MAG: TetR/AcrR family transcriptional regulator [Pseudomonas sp.]